MNLKNLSDDVLLQEVERLCAEERQTLTLLLHHLREVDRRRLYATLKYPSIFEYAVKKLGYSEDQAYRRIAAMRMLRELPEIEGKINSGALSLSNLGLANNFFNKEKQWTQKDFTKNDKLEVLEKLSNQSRRDAEKIILAMSSNPLQFREERQKPISTEMIELTFIVTAEVRDKVQKLKGLLAHKHPHLSTGELLEKLSDLGLEKWDRVAAYQHKDNKQTQQNEDDSKRHENKQNHEDSQNSENPISDQALLEIKKRSINQAALRRQVWRRDKGQCQNCGSSYALEIDHILPKAKGGEDTAENLRLLCRSCNQRSAIKHFGAHKMDQYLS